MRTLARGNLKGGFHPLFNWLQLDLDLHAGRQLQGHQGLHRLGGGLGDVDEALVGAALKLFAAVLVLVNSAQDSDCLLYTSRCV